MTRCLWCYKRIWFWQDKNRDYYHKTCELEFFNSGTGTNVISSNHYLEELIKRSKKHNIKLRVYSKKLQWIGIGTAPLFLTLMAIYSVKDIQSIIYEGDNFSIISLLTHILVMVLWFFIYYKSLWVLKGIKKQEDEEVVEELLK